MFNESLTDFVQVNDSPAEDPYFGWHQNFVGVQVGLFIDYEQDGNGKRTGFGTVRIGGQNVRARMPWHSDGKMAHLVMPVPEQTLVLVGFLAGQARTFAEAVIVTQVSRILVQPDGSDIPGVDPIFQTAQSGEHVIRSRWRASGTIGQTDDKTTQIYLKKDGSIEITVDEGANTPLKVTMDADRNVTLENVATLRAKAEKIVDESANVNLGDEAGAPVIRNVDHPQHVDPSTGILVTSFIYTSQSSKVKSS